LDCKGLSTMCRFSSFRFGCTKVPVVPGKSIRLVRAAYASNLMNLFDRESKAEADVRRREGKNWGSLKIHSGTRMRSSTRYTCVPSVTPMETALGIFVA